MPLVPRGGVRVIPTPLTAVPEDALPSFLPRGLKAPLTTLERFRMTGRWGQMSGPQLSAVLSKLDWGYVDDWMDLCEFAIASDTTLASLYVTRKSRVDQAEWVIKPSEYGDPFLARLAAEFCAEQKARVTNWKTAQSHLLHAIFTGVAFGEMEWDRETRGSNRVNFVREIHCLHGHRFRYDDKWQPRLYDYGRRVSANGVYGEVLDPGRFIVHTHQEISGYPNVAGVMRPAIWVWLFKRWVDQWYVQTAEKFGGPFIWFEVSPNTPGPVREELKVALDTMLLDHTFVVETPGAIHITPPSSGASSMHNEALINYKSELAKLILGASDTVDQGVAGSNAAVATRVGAAMDPRMITDGIGFAGTTESSFFKWSLAYNKHLFGGKMPPVPTTMAKTATDEVKTDLQGLHAQGGGRAPSVSSGADVGQASSQTAPVEQQVIPNSAGAATDPKALSRSSRQQAKQLELTHTQSRAAKTSPTSGPLAQILAETLRGASVDRRP